MSWGSCPHCGSHDIRGSGGDLAGGDEYQDRACFTCGASTYWLRSEGCKDGNWSADRDVVYRAPHASAIGGGDAVERDLLDQIACSPDDDALRAVYADLLIAREDPRGAFIAAQLARTQSGDTPSREERELLEQHWTAWLGPAARVVAPYKIEFVRGFWSACDALDAKAVGELDDDDRRTALTCHAWSTVRRLVVRRSYFEHLDVLLAGPIHRSLRVLHVDGFAQLDKLVAAHRAVGLSLEELRFRPDYSDKLPDNLADRAARFAGLALPSLRRVVVYGGTPGAIAEGALTVTVVADDHGQGPTEFPIAASALRLKRR